MVDPRITYTPNLKLTKLPENFHVWAQIMNDNLSTMDAAISGFIVFNNLRGVWTNSTSYAIGDSVVDITNASIWSCQVAHISGSIPTTFLQDRTAFPTYWSSYTAIAHARGSWTGPGTSYLVNDFVVAGGNKYAVCLFAHVSSASFTTDTAAGYWSVLIDLSAAGSLVLPILGGAPDANKLVITNPAGTAYTIQTVISALATGGATSIGTSLLTASSQASARTTINAVDSTGSTAFGLSLLTVADINTLVQMVGGTPSGVIQAFPGTVIPTGWLLCAGQTVSRTTFANLFSVINITFNTGGEAGSDFRLPDMRGRVIAGLDNMGGTAALRITAAGQAGIAGTTLGAAGGAQDNTLDTNRMPIHAHGYTEPNSGQGHNHGYTEPNSGQGHAHVGAGLVGNNLLNGTGRAVGTADGTNSGYFQDVSVGFAPSGIAIAFAGSGIAISSAGGGGAHNNTQPTIMLNYIIKT